ncbi:MAG: alkaline phosphatase family protein [Bacteroidaceae bacterium]|nr:alkaline phosphatase family protein [Bacteroidaceae bacterium]
MKHRISYLNRIARVRAAVLICLLLWGVHTVAQPRLVVGIIIDQMRWDYLERYGSRFGTGGFQRMMREGYNATYCHVNYLPAVTAVGHACVYTGTVPAFTGIASNYFYKDGVRVYAAEDKEVHTVGSTSAYGQMSPRNLLPTTVTDELRLATNFRGKTIGVALKDRAAILPAGHAATAAYWMDGGKNTDFITSSYYMEELPQWVRDFNARKLAEQYMQRNWPKQLKYAPETYVQSHGFDPRIEHMVGDEIRNTPWGASITFDMAMAAIEGEELGSDDVPDMLTVSVSSTDALSHRVGTHSPYIEDAYLWLDDDLTRFFQFLDQKVGRGRWTAFLTADHAGQHAPQFREDHKLPSQVWESSRIVPALNTLVERSFGKTGPFVINIHDYRIDLDEATIRRAGLTPEQVCDVVCDSLRRMPEVQYAFDMERMPDYLPEPLRTMTRNGYHPKRSGRIMVVPEAGVMEAFRYGDHQNKKGASHALWTPDDTHIPCLFLGYGVPQGRRDSRPCRIVDIAPTVAQVLGIQQPSACVGQPLFDIPQFTPIKPNNRAHSSSRKHRQR